MEILLHRWNRKLTKDSPTKRRYLRAIGGEWALAERLLRAFLVALGLIGPAMAQERNWGLVQRG
jgi:hypothetical protein